MEKRTLIALAISFAVLGFYPVLLQKFYPDYYKNSEKEKLRTPGAASSANTSFTSGTKALTDSLKHPGVYTSNEDLVFSNQKLNLVFNGRGAGIRQAEFPEFKSQETKSPLRFFSLENPDGAATSIYFFEANPSLSPEPPIYQITQESPEALTASASWREGLKLVKRYEFAPAGYSGNLALQFENTSDKPMEFRYQLFAGTSISPRNSIDGQYIEANFYSTTNGKASLRHIRETKSGKTILSAGSVEWAAVKDRHFSVILKPKAASSFTGMVEGLGNRHLRGSLVSSTVTLLPHQSLRHDFQFYIGPNDLEELLPLGLDPIVNFGKLDVIGKLLVGALEMVHRVCRNYGLSIVVLTALINLMLFPFTRASYLSMKRMQLIQPQMNKLREQNKKNPEKLNREMMELYKKHKVNPFGGCLPMLIQMPVFIALYVALSKSVILINASFLWVKDLSTPDNLHLPFPLPVLGHEIHVLPLIMVGAMAAQQKLTQIKMQGQDPTMESQQKMMAVMMPLVFGFIFYNMPSGLVLYWLTNTLLMTAYQLRIKNMTLS